MGAGGHQAGVLALGAHAAITGAEPDLGFPGDVPHLFGQTLEALEQARRATPGGT